MAGLSLSEFRDRVYYPVLVLTYAREGSLESDTHSLVSRPTPDASQMDTLVVAFEPQEEIRTGPWSTKLGRGVGAGVLVPFETVSRAHALLERDGEGRYSVTDVGSKNGTWVNGHELKHHKVQPLRDGDRVKFGNVEGNFYAPRAFHAFLQAKSRPR
jgi:hypothetical protein